MSEESETFTFYIEFLALCQKHRLAIVPTFGGEVSFHDPMRIIPLNAETEKFLKQTEDDK